MARVLLVEDDVDVRPAMEHIMSTEGYRPTAVETVSDAVAQLERNPFDLVVTDVFLPDGNGLVIADRAKELGVTVLVITGYGLKLKPGSLANYDYLLKPIRAAELVREIRRRLPPDLVPIFNET